MNDPVYEYKVCTAVQYRVVFVAEKNTTTPIPVLRTINRLTDSTVLYSYSIR